MEPSNQRVAGTHTHTPAYWGKEFSPSSGSRKLGKTVGAAQNALDVQYTALAASTLTAAISKGRERAARQVEEQEEQEEEEEERGGGKVQKRHRHSITSGG